MSDLSHLSKLGMSKTHQEVFAMGMKVMDEYYRPPLLFASAKLSMWYAVGLLARGTKSDMERANLLLSNAMTLQDLDPVFEQNYGSFKKHINVPYSSGHDPLWVGTTYDSYDPNNALFFTMAAMMMESLYADKLEPELRKQMHKAMHVACIGNSKREGGWHGDDMWPSYSNPWFLRCVCTTFTGKLVNDEALVKLSEVWAKDAIELFDRYDTPGEFNSPTYAGVTLMALGLAQYCPQESSITKAAPRMMKAIWEATAEAYNPTLLNLAGPWDRGYGYCMTQYYSTIGANIMSATGVQKKNPIPSPLIGSEHCGDVCLVPMQMITAPYTEADLSQAVRQMFSKLDTPRLCTPKSIFPPHDKRAREYTFWIANGLSIGGVSFDEDQIGGPKGIDSQFNPGVIQWDSGDHGSGCGWISVWPNNACCTFVASESALTVKYTKPVDFPGSPQSNSISLRIGALPFVQLDQNSFKSGNESFPGLDVQLSGNVVDKGERTIKFSAETKLHGAFYYDLTYTFPQSLREGGDPTLVISVKKTEPPQTALRF